MNSARAIKTSVDPVIFTVFEGKLHTLIVKRNIEPYNGCWSLPGGIIDPDKDHDLQSAAMRKLKEKTNVVASYLEQVETIGNESRDPGGWSITVVYYALIPKPDSALSSDYGASDVRWETIEDGRIALPLAFDHNRITELALERLRNKVEYTSVAAHLLPETFTTLDLLGIHELILGRKIEKKSIERRYVGLNLLKDTGKRRTEGPGRPAVLYTLKDKKIHFFVRSLEGPK